MTWGYLLLADTRQNRYHSIHRPNQALLTKFNLKGCNIMRKIETKRDIAARQRGRRGGRKKSTFLIYILVALALIAALVAGLDAWIKKDKPNNITSEISLNNPNMPAGSVNPYREVVDYYKSVTTPTASANDREVANMITMAIDDDIITVKELTAIRDLRRSHLEVMAKDALERGEFGLPSPSLVTYDPINVSTQTDGMYQDVLNYKAAATEMIDSDAKVREELISKIDTALSDKSLTVNEYQDIRIIFNQIDESMDKQQLISMAKLKD